MSCEDICIRAGVAVPAHARGLRNLEEVVAVAASETVVEIADVPEAEIAKGDRTDEMIMDAREDTEERERRCAGFIAHYIANSLILIAY